MDYYRKKLLIGTNTNGNEPNSIMVVSLEIPNSVFDLSKFDEGLEYGTANINLNIQMQISTEGEVNRARYMPQNTFLIAAQGISGDINLFDLTRHPSRPTNNQFKPDLILKSHTEEGYGLNWSHTKSGYLLSGNNDSTV